MAKIGHEYSATAREISVNTSGLSFLCIVGKHVNGGYIAILNFGLSAELSGYPDDVSYNAGKIYNALFVDESGWLPKDSDALKKIALEIAEAIEPYLNGGDGND